MNIQFNSEQNSVYITLSSGEYDRSKKISETVIVDVTKDGSVLGIEVLDVGNNVQNSLEKTRKTPVSPLTA